MSKRLDYFSPALFLYCKAVCPKRKTLPCCIQSVLLEILVQIPLLEVIKGSRDCLGASLPLLHCLELLQRWMDR